MDSWTQQMGFPLITVEKIGPTTIRASQSRFLLTAALNQSVLEAASPFQYRWFVPLSYYTDQDPSDVTHVWMNLTDGTLKSRNLESLLFRNIKKNIYINRAKRENKSN